MKYSLLSAFFALSLLCFAQNQQGSAELLPDKIDYAGITFALTTSQEGMPLAAVPRGQTISLPAGTFNRFYLLAASAAGDQKATFRCGDNQVELTIQDWSGFIGPWAPRTWNKNEELRPARQGAAVRRNPGFIKRAGVAWFASHRHTADGANEPYSHSYLFAYWIDIPRGARTLTLPDDDRIRSLAMRVSDETSQALPAQRLYDTLKR